MFRFGDEFGAADKPYDPLTIEEELFRVVPLGDEFITMSNDDIQRHMKSTSLSTHGHRHNSTCKKGGRKGDDTDCRMGFSRSIVGKTCRIADCMFAMQQTIGRLVPFVPAMQLACPGNHMISPTMDASRYVRELLLHKRAIEKDPHANLSQPTLKPEIINSYICSEYNTGYVTKSEERYLNQAIIKCAGGLEIGTKSIDQQRRSIIAKSLNALGKTMQFASVITSTYLLGYGDSWYPLRDEMHDFAAFTRMLQQTPSQYDDERVGHSFTMDSDLLEKDADDSTPDRNYAFTTQPFSNVKKYQNRSPALDDWSPYELSMCFTCVSTTTKSRAEYPVAESTLCHKPRQDRQGKHCIAVLRQFKEHPRQPAPSSDVASKENYAAWALGNFYSDRLIHNLRSAQQAADDNVSPLWNMLQTWRLQRPRGLRDEFAFRCLDNIENRLLAREFMRTDQRESADRQKDMRTIFYEDGDERKDSNDTYVDAEEDPFDGLSDDVMNRLSDLHEQNDGSKLDLARFPVNVHAARGNVIKEGASTFDTSRAKAAMDQSKQMDNNAGQKQAEVLRPQHKGDGELTGAYVSLQKEPKFSAPLRTYKVGDNMPYVKMETSPTPQLTAALHGLSKEQSFAFYMTTDTLLEEMDGTGDVPQLLLAIVGNAGIQQF